MSGVDAVWRTLCGPGLRSLCHVSQYGGYRTEHGEEVQCRMAAWRLARTFDPASTCSHVWCDILQVGSMPICDNRPACEAHSAPTQSLAVGVTRVCLRHHRCNVPRAAGVRVQDAQSCRLGTAARGAGTASRRRGTRSAAPPRRRYPLTTISILRFLLSLQSRGTSTVPFRPREGG
jgi:hypothetical protein